MAASGRHSVVLAVIATFLAVPAAHGWGHRGLPSSVAPLRRTRATAHPSASLKPGADDDAASGADPEIEILPLFDDEEEDPLVDELREGEVEDVMFRFTAEGEPKPWALKPHLRQMMENVRAGKALLLDVRPRDAWEVGHVDGAVHCPLAELTKQDAASSPPSQLPSARDALIYTHSALVDEGSDGVRAAVALKAMGFTNVRALSESFEALAAQLAMG